MRLVILVRLQYRCLFVIKKENWEKLLHIFLLHNTERKKFSTSALRTFVDIWALRLLLFLQPRNCIFYTTTLSCMDIGCICFKEREIIYLKYSELKLIRQNFGLQGVLQLNTVLGTKISNNSLNHVLDETPTNSSRGLFFSWSLIGFIHLAFKANWKNILENNILPFTRR